MSGSEQNLPPAKRVWRSRSGFSYVAILVMTMILTTLALAFISRSGILSSAVLGRHDRIQAEYLADTAIQHGLWAIRNDAGSIKNDTTYYMHSLAGGRYGYRVRVPTSTTFATIAAIGQYGDFVARQSYVAFMGVPGFQERLYTAYWSDYLVIGGVAYPGNPGPKWREWTDSTWTDDAFAYADPAEALWVELEGSPRSNEMVMGVQKSDGTVEVSVFDGSAWGNRMGFPSYGGEQCFDLAYESVTGDALLLAGTDGYNAVMYSVWNGAAWAPNPPDTAFQLNKPEAHVVKMASHPETDEILAVVLNGDDELEAFVWDGDGFSSEGKIDDKIPLLNTGAFDLAYERLSGHALVVYGEQGNNKSRYREWTGTGFDGAKDIWDFGRQGQLFRLEPDPTDNYMLLAAGDGFSDLHLVVWNGSAWTDHREVETNLPSDQVVSFDVAWRSTGDEALFAWGKQSYGKIFYLEWTKGTGFSSIPVKSGPAISMNIHRLRLQSVARTDETVCLVVDNLKTLVSSVHDDGGFGAGEAVTYVNTSGSFVFDMAVTRP
ncbi:MAG: hypothetical protein ABIK65_03310 [Candidatus Eisenbacteria bacterium]